MCQLCLNKAVKKCEHEGDGVGGTEERRDFYSGVTVLLLDLLTNYMGVLTL